MVSWVRSEHRSKWCVCVLFLLLRLVSAMIFDLFPSILLKKRQKEDEGNWNWIELIDQKGRSDENEKFDDELDLELDLDLDLDLKEDHLFLGQSEQSFDEIPVHHREKR